MKITQLYNDQVNPIKQNNKWIQTRAKKDVRYNHYEQNKNLDISLKEKERWSIELIKMALQRSDNPSLSNSFGIDSMVVLYLTRKALIELGKNPSDINIIWNDTANEFKEVRQFQKYITDKWNLKLTIAKPKKTLKHIINDNGGVTTDYFFTRKGDRRNNKQQLSEKCCNILKHKPMKEMLKQNNWDLMIVGLRADESNQRFLAALRDGEYFYSSAEWKSFVLRPILWWTEDDIWEYVNQENIPYNDLYKNNLIQTYPNNISEIIDQNEDELNKLNLNIHLLKESQLQTVNRQQALYLNKIGFNVFTPRTGCMMCPIRVKYGYLSWIRRYYPKVFDAMIYNLGYGETLLEMIPNEVKKEIEYITGINLNEKNAHEYLKDILEAKPCAFDQF